MPVKIVIKGLDRVSGKFTAIYKKFDTFLEDATLQVVIYVHSKIPRYPPQPPTSKYRRTGTLGRTVTSLMGKAPSALSRVESMNGDVTGFVGTNLSYAFRVIDEDNQTKVHKRNGWWTLQEVVTSLRAGIKRKYETELRKFLKKEYP